MRRELATVEVVRPVEAEAVHECLTTTLHFETERLARRYRLVQHCTDRSVDCAQEKLEIRTTLHLRTSNATENDTANDLASYTVCEYFS